MNMDKDEFKHLRTKLNKTQKQMSQLLGTSIKAVHSYEQGWRAIPAAVERQILFLVSHQKLNQQKLKKCWTIKKCPPVRKKECPAWEFQAGDMCWFINGTFCEGEIQENWKEKMHICRSCEVFMPMLR